MVTSWLAHNPRATTAPTYGDAQRFAVDPKGIPELCEELKQCPRHVPTPLHSLPDLAARLGLGEIRVKDESQRFGFGAFKALGGVIAVYDALAGAVAETHHPRPSFAALIGGAVVTESVFAIPGLGRLTVDAILRRDYPVIQGVVLLFSFMYVLVNLGVDLLYTLFDPRIRY